MLDRNTGVARALWRKADRAEGTAESRSMDKEPNPDGRQNQYGQLRWNDAEEIALAEKQERRWEARKIVNPACDRLGKPSKERKRPQCDNERRQFQPGN